MSTYPTYYLIEKLNEVDRIDDYKHYLMQFYNDMSTELENRYEDTTQLYFGEPDNHPIILPIQLFDEDGYEVIEPITYNGYEPIW